MVKDKILLSAYSCEPGFTSERGVGWNWALQISKYYDVWVLTRLSNKRAIEAELRRYQRQNLHFIYYDLPKWMRFWKKAERGLYLYYLLWQLGSLYLAFKTHKMIKFKIVHYVTFGNFLLPNFLFLLPTKLVLGPMGGGENVPLRFLAEFSLRGRLREIFRHLLQKLLFINPLFYLMCAKASVILVRTKETRMMIPRIFRSKVIIFMETGVPEDLLRIRDAVSENESKGKSNYEIITVGRLLYCKVNILALKAIKVLKSKYQLPLKFYIVGDGPERLKLQRYCRTNNLERDVLFTGWLSREEVYKYLLKCDVYLSTSFKEGGSWALFEAIAAGLPVISLKATGPDLIISDDSGIKVDIISSHQVVGDLADALCKLTNDYELRRRLNKNALKYLISNYSWDEMGKRVHGIYEKII